MAELTERQIKLLGAVINEYVETALPVGSEVITQKYDLQVSSATIRNEMAALTNEGYLQKPHTSAGRIPTDLGFRFYIKNLMQEKEIPVVSEVAIKQRLWPQRHDSNNLLTQAAQALAEETKNLSLVLTDEGRLYTAGSSNVLRHPEFYDIDLTRTVLEMLDRSEVFANIFNRIPKEQSFGVLLGGESGVPGLNECGVIFSRFSLPRGQGGYLGILGPTRLPYPKVVPMVKYFAELVNELSKGW